VIAFKFHAATLYWHLNALSAENSAIHYSIMAAIFNLEISKKTYASEDE
jgi:hypothetical protein